MCIYLSVFSVFVCIRVRRYILFVYIYVHVYAFRVCVYFICLLGVFVRIFIWVCIRILCVMYSWVFLVVASSSLFASLVLPSVLVYWFIDLLIYCYTFLLVLVVSIGFYCFLWFLKTPKICRSLRFSLLTIQLCPFFLENAKFARF